MIDLGLVAQLRFAVGSAEFWAAFWPNFFGTVAGWAVTVGLPTVIASIVFRKKLKAAFQWTGALIAKVWRAVWSVRLTTTTRQDALQSTARADGEAEGFKEGQADVEERVNAAIEAGEKQLAQTRRSLGNEARERNQKTDIAAARNKGREEGYEQGLKDGRTASQPLDHELQAAPKPSPPPLARWKITIEPGQQFVALHNGPTRFILENLSGLSFAMHVRVNGPENFDFDDAAEWKEFAGGTSQVFAGSAHDASGNEGVEFTVTWIAFGGEVKTDKVRVRPWLHMPSFGSGSVPRG